MEKASVTRRFFAYMIDSIVLSMLNFAYRFISSETDAAQTIGLAIPALYFIWFYSTSGQTLGKRALGIKVVSIDGSPLNWRKGVLRSVGYVLSSIPFGLGFLWAIWDKDKQAGHDKIAGTCVVPVSVAQEQLQGSIEPAEVQRRRKRWLIGLGIPTVLIALGFSLLFGFLIGKGMSEISEMGPWPGPEVSPEMLIKVNMASIGLEVGEIRNARGSKAWANGIYKEGVLIIYESGAKRILTNVWALQYETKQAAGNDFNSVRAWIEGGNCGRYSWVTSGNAGVITCQFSDGYNKILWNDYWILDILAMEGSKFTPDVLVDQVRDAIAAHWRTFTQLSMPAA